MWNFLQIFIESEIKIIVIRGCKLPQFLGEGPRPPDLLSLPGLWPWNPLGTSFLPHPHRRPRAPPNENFWCRHSICCSTGEFCSVYEAWHVSTNSNGYLGFIARKWLRYVRVFAIANPSVVCLSVCNVGAPYLGGFDNISSPLCTLAILWSLCRILRRPSQGNPYVEGVKRNTSSEIDRCWTCRRLYSHKRYKIDV